jgi:hypothetical protein
MHNRKFEAVWVCEEDRIVARRLLRIVGRLIENLSTNPFEEHEEAIDVCTTRGAKRDVVQTGRGPIVLDASPIALRKSKSD